MADRSASDYLSAFLQYLAVQKDGEQRIPPLSDLSQELGISIASLREQLEVARALGLVEVRPRTGIRRQDYSFRPAVMQSLAYAVTSDLDRFKDFADFRNHIESSYFHQSVTLLTNEDYDDLRKIVRQAFDKLHGNPVQIPYGEHRELHLTIYRRLNNAFVIGVLEAYWELYQAVGLDLYFDLAYQEQVWQYHQRIVDEICAGNFQAAYQVFAEHIDLIYLRAKPIPSQKFE